MEASTFILFLGGTSGVTKSLWQQQKQQWGRSLVGVEPFAGRLFGIDRNYYKDVAHQLGNLAAR
jgi:hypothetical protein